MTGCFPMYVSSSTARLGERGLEMSVGFLDLALRGRAVRTRRKWPKRKEERK